MLAREAPEGPAVWWWRPPWRASPVACASEWTKLLKVDCDFVELTSDIGSLRQLMDQIFLKPAVQLENNARVQSSAPQCIDYFKTFCIGKAFIGSERCAVCHACLLQRVRPSQHNSMCCRGLKRISVMLHGDVTSKASSAELNQLSLGVNMLGGHCMPWATALIQAETE